MKGVDRTGFRFVIDHFDEGKAALAPGISLQGERTIHHFAVSCKQLSDIFLLCTEGQIANKNTHEPILERGLAPGPGRFRSQGPIDSESLGRLRATA